jgi:hypothetical protein
VSSGKLIFLAGAGAFCNPDTFTGDDFQTKENILPDWLLSKKIGLHCNGTQHAKANAVTGVSKQLVEQKRR